MNPINIPSKDGPKFLSETLEGKKVNGGRHTPLSGTEDPIDGLDLPPVDLFVRGSNPRTKGHEYEDPCVYRMVYQWTLFESRILDLRQPFLD